VRLAAAECSLKLDDGLAALAIEALGDLREQTAHTLRDKSAFVKCFGIAVFWCRFAGAHCSEVSRELGLLERAI
jgi:hypothetical protein